MKTEKLEQEFESMLLSMPHDEDGFYIYKQGYNLAMKEFREIKEQLKEAIIVIEEMVLYDPKNVRDEAIEFLKRWE
jgi:uncharacterized protein (DUF2164 family)